MVDPNFIKNEGELDEITRVIIDYIKKESAFLKFCIGRIFPNLRIR